MNTFTLICGAWPLQNKLLSSRAFDQMVYCSHNSCHLSILWKKGQALIVIHVTDGKNHPRKCILPPCFSTVSFYVGLLQKTILVLFVFMLQLLIFFLSSFLFFKNHDYNHSPSISSLWMQNPDGLADGAWKIG